MTKYLFKSLHSPLIEDFSFQTGTYSPWLFMRNWDWQCVKQVYQDFLLELEDDNESDDESDNLDEILWKLKDCHEQIVIMEFITRLFAHLSVKYKTKYRAILDKIEKLAKANIIKYKFNPSHYNQALKRFRNEYKNKFYLIVAINENYSYPNSFQVSGWLATDEISKSASKFHDK